MYLKTDSSWSAYIVFVGFGPTGKMDYKQLNETAAPGKVITLTKIEDYEDEILVGALMNAVRGKKWF